MKAQTEYAVDTWTWQSEASCRGVDPDVFFPSTEDEAGAAMSICATCPVRVHCLASALQRGERYGVWGGMTEKERATLSPTARERILRAATAA